ncbi:MAG: hypothetical protein ACLRWQ_08160 [Flavonifractor plautii]
MKVVVMQSVAGDSTITSIYSQDREWVIYAFAAAYLLVLCLLVGGKQPHSALSAWCSPSSGISFGLSALVYCGWSPFWVAVLICIVTTLVTMYLPAAPPGKPWYCRRHLWRRDCLAATSVQPWPPASRAGTCRTSRACSPWPAPAGFRWAACSSPAC